MTRRGFAAVAAAAIALRVGFIAIAAHSSVPFYDNDDLLVRAQALRHHEPLARALSHNYDDVLRPPVYPAAVALGLSAGLSESGVLIAQTLLTVLTLWAVSALAAELAGPRAAMPAVLLCALWPMSIAASATFAAEHVETPLIATALVLLIRACRRSNAGLGCAAGVVFAAATLTRSTSLYLAIPVAIVAALRNRTVAVAMTCSLLVVVVPYSLFISRAAGRVVIVENVAEWNWNVENGGKPANAGRVARLPLLAHDVAGAWSRAPVVYAKSAVWRSRRVLLTGETFIWFNHEQMPPALDRLVWAATLVLLVGAYVAAVVGAVVSPNRFAVVLLGVWIALYAVVIVMSPAIEPRHRTPIEPALWALAGASILIARE